MKLKVDHAFHIGEQHLRQGKPGQDYALSGTLGTDTAFAIVADGCSSGGHTDVGARLSALATKRAIVENAESEASLPHVNRVRDAYAESFRTTLGLEHRDMLATNLFVVAWPNRAVINVTGDGVVAIQFGTELSLIRFSWNQNTPYYPAYRLAGQDESFQAVHTNSEHPLTQEYLDDDTNHPTGLTVEAGMAGITIGVTGAPDQERPLIAVGLFSDGVEQVENLSTIEVARALMSFKSTSGQFATRRMNRFLSDAKKRGRGPLDDIAMAVVHLAT